MKYLLTVVFILNTLFYGTAQDTTIVLSTSMFNKEGKIYLGEIEHWLYKQGNDPSWANPGIAVNNWQHLNPAEITKKQADQNGRLEGWFRMKIKLDSSFSQTALFIRQRGFLASDIFINGKPFYSFGNTGYNGKPYQEFTDFTKFPEAIKLEMGKELLLAIHFVDYTDYRNQLKETSFTKDGFIAIANTAYLTGFHAYSLSLRRSIVILCILGVLAVLFWFLFFLNRSEDHLVFVALSTTSLLGLQFFHFLKALAFSTYNREQLWEFLATISFAGVFTFLPILVAKVFKNYIPLPLKIYAIASTILAGISFFTGWDKISLANELISFLICTYYLIVSRKILKGAKWAIVIGLILTQLIGASMDTINNFKVDVSYSYSSLLMFGSYLSFPLSLLVYVALRMKEVNADVLSKAEKIVQVTEEKKDLLASQNRLLEEQVKERTTELTQSLDNLKATQSQLIQSEKMASLGELTAGIAHEIQNPLNFVNNFSEVNTELIDELQQELKSGNTEEAISISNDIRDNEEKINHHGKRADAIVKGMLQHSRSSSGVKEPTDINALCDEYLRLSYHGLRAKDKSFNATLETVYDTAIGSLNIVPQDIGRVILNLITNAFYAVNEKQKVKSETSKAESYQPTVTVSTKKINGNVEITVKDNGNGIPQNVLEKIFQPFFTTKPTGQGTGLGLSLSYDIVKAHGGELKVETKEGVGTEFIIQLPI
ncbi:MAG: ATP-binding protein [Sediminibacterium sp.]|nr:ATP-binding protein [Sediminibacterium sp.]MDP3128920.1 ATP-binding protein [Sediminibacterium sp.]